MLRLSIIVNMYNTAKYMQKCVDSLLCQDIPAEEYEIIFVDDCSPDNSLEMANQYKDEELRTRGKGGSYPQIKVCHHELNRGLAAGRNTGVDAAEGKYLCFVDPDDYIEKNSLKALLDQMDAENLDMLRFDYQKVDEAYKNIAHNHAERSLILTPKFMTGIDFLATRLGILCYVWPYIYRTELIKGDEAKGEKTIRFVEDCYFDDVPWLPRVLMRAQRVNCNPIKHQYYLQRQGSMVRTASMMRKIEGQIRVIILLQDQMQNTAGLVQKWYERMIAFSASSIMGSIAALEKEDAYTVIGQLEKLQCFPMPLTVYNKKRAVLKQMMMNINPRLYWQLIHKRYKTLLPNLSCHTR